MLIANKDCENMKREALKIRAAGRRDCLKCAVWQKSELRVSIAGLW